MDSTGEPTLEFPAFYRFSERSTETGDQSGPRLNFYRIYRESADRTQARVGQQRRLFSERSTETRDQSGSCPGVYRESADRTETPARVAQQCRLSGRLRSGALRRHRGRRAGRRLQRRRAGPREDRRHTRRREYDRALVELPLASSPAADEVPRCLDGSRPAAEPPGAVPPESASGPGVAIPVCVGRRCAGRGEAAARPADPAVTALTSRDPDYRCLKVDSHWRPAVRSPAQYGPERARNARFP